MRTLSSSLQNQPRVPANVSLAPPLILIAEDDEDSRVMFGTMLKLQGCRVIEAADGNQAVQLADQAGPDLILMDAGLPGLDGFAATRRIRRARRVPIVFMSGYAEASFVAQARQAGCDEYLVKPISFDQLEEVIKKYTATRSQALGR
jgi:CheY-like chemotaxis protein